jgi:hypothetical protein
MIETINTIVTALISAGIVSAILGFLLHRRTVHIEEEIKNQFALLQSRRAWKEQMVAELLGPLYIHFDRTKRAFDRWDAQNLYLEAKIIRDGNLAIRDLLIMKSHLIPKELRVDAGELIEHYDRWLEEFEKIRGREKPDLDTPFVFVGTQGFPFPHESERRFREGFTRLWDELYMTE